MTDFKAGDYVEVYRLEHTHARELPIGKRGHVRRIKTKTCMSIVWDPPFVDLMHHDYGWCKSRFRLVGPLLPADAAALEYVRRELNR